MSIAEGIDAVSPPRAGYVWLMVWILVCFSPPDRLFRVLVGTYMLLNHTLVYVSRGDHVQLFLWIVAYVVLAATLLQTRTAALATILFIPLLGANRAFNPHAPSISFYVLRGFNICAVAFVLFSERRKLTELVR